MRAKLEKYLFEEAGARAFAVLDGASIDDLPARLYEMQPRAVCLYRGEIEPDIAEVAPYLVELFAGDAFTEWLLDENAGGRHFGIFARSPHSLTEMRKHFRKFLTVYDEAGNPLLFRYYDPRVLRKFLPTCGAADLGRMFAGVQSFLAEKTAVDYTRFEMRDDRLAATDI